ncbi:glutamate racemase [Candidatus Saccharibacteria bacterium]|nr:glutamate racemase [Candidatus Saccharibacteria bacterium]
MNPSPASKIAVLDSGIGGTTTLREIRKLLKSENFLYFGDSKNCPYGEKTDAELLKLSRNNVERLLKENIKILVVACNTLTTRVLAPLRKEFPELIFVGTEPAIKPALESGAKKIVILSTPATARSLEENQLKSLNYSKTISSSPQSTPTSPSAPLEILNLPCPTLAAAIESRDNRLIDETLATLLGDIKKETRAFVESVVLGCTHYPIIKEKIKSYFPNAELVDGNAAIARRVKDILEQKNLLNQNPASGVVEYIYT